MAHAFPLLARRDRLEFTPTLSGRRAAILLWWPVFRSVFFSFFSSFCDLCSPGAPKGISAFRSRSCASRVAASGQRLEGSPLATFPCGDTAENVLFLCNGAHSDQDSLRNRLLRLHLRMLRACQPPR